MSTSSTPRPSTSSSKRPDYDPEYESSDSDSTSSSDDENSIDDDEITPEYLEGLLEKSRQKAREVAQAAALSEHVEEEVMILSAAENASPLPPLDPGALPAPYLTFAGDRHERPLAVNDPDIMRAEQSTSEFSTPAPPIPPPELTASGKPLTKKERKAMKKMTAGPGWFDLPAPAESDLPRLYQEVEALRLRNQLDPKRFYRKDEGEGKGIKGLPKYFAMGTILPTDTPFGNPSSDNLPKSHRKRTLVDELVDDAEAKRYAKKKFNELQAIRGSKGRGTLAAKKASRRQKW